MAGYKRTISDLEKRLVEAEKPCTKRHLEDHEDNPSLLAQAELKEQLSAYESEIEMLRRRDSEREAELNRLRELVRSISNGNVADGVSRPPFSPKVYGIDLLKALNEYLDEERAQKDEL